MNKNRPGLARGKGDGRVGVRAMAASSKGKSSRTADRAYPGK